MKKRTERQKLIKQADDWFSRRVRLEAADHRGLGKCFDCGKTIIVKANDCGHFFSRRNMSTRWDLDNCRLQAKMCNYGMGRPETNKRFRDNLLKDLGEKKFNALEIRHFNTWKPHVFDLEMIIHENQVRVSYLLHKKELTKWW